MTMNLLKNFLDNVGLLDKIKYWRDYRRFELKKFESKISTLQVVSSQEKKDIVAVLPPALSSGSLGDEALIKGILSYYRRSETVVKPISFVGVPEWDFLDSPIVEIDYFKPNLFLAAEQLASVKHVLIIGADVMDGGYGIKVSLLRIQMARILATLGIPVTITGFSFNDSCPIILKYAYSALPKSVNICMRDPVSKRRFEQYTGVSSTLTADLAFLMQPVHSDNNEYQHEVWLDQKRSKNRKIVGINICPHSASNHVSERSNEGLSDLLEIYEQAIELFLIDNPDYDVLFIAHDYRTILSDISLALILCNRLEQRFGDRVNCIESWISAAEIKGVLSKVNIVFTGRMHLAIASLGMSVPVACLTYQGKFEGLFEHFNLDHNFTLGLSELNPKRMCAILSELAESQTTQRLEISERLEKIEALASLNFSDQA